MTLKVTQGHSN